MPRAKKKVDSDTGLTMQWYIVHKIIRRRIFKIRSPRGHGTGFHIGSFGKNGSLAAIATARHVIESEHEWGEPIKVLHEESGKEVLLKVTDRAIFTFPPSDTAIIVFQKPTDLDLPKEEVPYFRNDKSIFPGVDISWCGFPSVQPDKPCFFHGYISCNLEKSGYLVDGVVINGVSGGPVFFIDGNDPILFGVISAYKPNHHAAGPLPGLGVISSIPDEYEKEITSLRNFTKAAEEAAKNKASTSTEQVDADTTRE